MGDSALAAHGLPPPVLDLVRKQQVLAGFSLRDVRQLLPGDLQGARNRAVAGLLVGRLQDVAQKRDACLGLLSQIVDGLRRHDHLGSEGHAFRMAVSRAMEEVAHVRGPGVLIAHRRRCFHQRLAGQRLQKADRVEQIGFAGAVGTDHAGERTEPHVHVHQVLETGDSQAGQHRPFSSPAPCRATSARPTTRPVVRRPMPSVRAAAARRNRFHHRPADGSAGRVECAGW